MDFTEDALASGRKFRTLNLMDGYTREALALEVDTSLPGARVVRVLERLRESGRRPAAAPGGQRDGVHQPGGGPVGVRARRDAAFQPPWQAHG